MNDQSGLDSYGDLIADARGIRTVMVVDDSRAHRHLIALHLREWGYDVLQAASGAEALALCRDHPVDLILSDWMMPGMSGIDLCRAFRAMARETYGYFILLTSKTDRGAVAEGLDVGADDFLAKPVHAIELRARIKAGDRLVKLQDRLQFKNARLHDALRKLQSMYDTLDGDLIEARKLQQSLVRERFRDFGRAQVSVLLRPCGHIGGDMVGFFPVTGDVLGLFAFDVSGHGVASAMMTARLAGLLSVASKEQNIALFCAADGYHARAPVDVATRMNNLILSEMRTENYATLAYGVADLRNGQVAMVQAGHPHPIVQRASGAIEWLGDGGLPVGLIAGAEYDGFQIDLLPGDRLLFVSDGVTECTNAQGEELGQDGLATLLDRLRDQRGQALLDTLVWDVARWSGRDEFADDISATLLEYSG
ncbi:PP2C family protein-serine/threonine phosphatase [Roseicitreum antarcticum]|uniref:Serine phosphatase RsbU, regulator of sigma subunit n=1 Tax=Roseicitreum antarcticum TaxID=564137 RepID=A0A1H2X312_9RHOB|nr:fused response regulator/phosphatase [Roseicitreum antarcticum]SDW87262.1 Serine phosphatase RsbU, regulator of sigma subunit [Roseicitreum antarcticum]